MSARRPAALLAALLAAVLALGAVQSGQESTRAIAPDSASTWRDVLTRAAPAGRDLGYHGRVLSVWFTGDGPSVVEMEVMQNSVGDMIVSDAGGWTVTRRHGDALYWTPSTDTTIALGHADRIVVGLELMGTNYDINLRASADLATGTATVLELRSLHGPPDSPVRERLFLDEDTGLVTRRESFSDSGAPIRVTAFSELVTESAAMPAQVEPSALPEPPSWPLAEKSLVTLSETGWHAPAELPLGFELQSSTAREAGGSQSLHLLYSDGVYTVSVYEQEGELAHGAMADVARRRLGPSEVYYWPDGQPQRMVWSGQGKTFTLITDAADDHIAELVGQFPVDVESSLIERVGRGLARMGDFMWPFN